MGLKPSSSPNADELRNKNLNKQQSDGLDQQISDVDEEADDGEEYEDEYEDDSDELYIDDL
jgi:hypothetical protein